MKMKRPVLYLLIILLLADMGCWSKMNGSNHQEIVYLPACRILILGFKPAISQKSKSAAFRSPVSGSVFMAEYVGLDVADKMTDKLFNMLLEFKDYNMISPKSRDWDASGTILSELVEDNLKAYMKMGQAFSADAVMVGYIYRWRERKGGEYSVDSPASVAFDLYLIKSEDGSIIWKGKYDKTQNPLSENVLDLGTFLKGKGKWMTVDELAQIGMVEMMKSLPLKPGSSK
jgi:hypothetical protein